jgi:hypothetical protein
MDAGILVNDDKQRGLSSKLIWAVGVIALCRGLLSTAVPTLRSVLNL